MFDRALFHLPHARRTLIVLVCFALAEALCIVGQSAGLSRALVTLWEGGALFSVTRPFGIFALSFLCVRIVLVAREHYISTYAYRTTEQLRANLLAAIFATGAPIVQRFGTGASVAMVLEGIDKVKNYIELVMPKFVNLAVLPTVFALAIFSADWVSGIVVIILLPSMILLMILIGKTTADRGRAQHVSFKVMSNHFIDSVRGIDTIETFEVSRSYAQRVFQVSERFRRATMATLKTATLSGSVLDLFATLAIAAVSIMLGLRLIDGSLTLLPALFVLILTPEFFRPIREFAADHHASLDGANALRTIQEMIAATADRPVPCELPCWSEASTLHLSHLSKCYGKRTALEDVTLELRGHARIGIIGESGSGKSTLLRLLAGLEDPSEGAFDLDGNALDTLRHPFWQDQIAYIPQDPYLFAATLRDNVAFYAPDASDERIEQAIDALGLRTLVEALPDGLDTPIGEGGQGLSGGQAQRIALARVLLDDTRSIVLFDEPTAHLDIETEYDLKRAMLRVMDEKLVVFATHRLHWLDSFDHIVVLEQGRVAEEGTLEQLRASGAHFRGLVAALRGGDVA